MKTASALNSAGKRNLTVLAAALAAVYLIWGSTYLAIKYAIETLPPFLMAGTRFLIAGTILFFAAGFSKDYEKPTAAHWRTSAIVGALLLLGGNGGVVIAQHYLPSSFAALLIATEPFWIVIIGWLVMKNSRPNLRVVLGLIIGFIGVSLLISGRGISFGDGNGQIFGIGLVIFSTLAWAAGSLYGVRGTSPKSALLGAGMQMLAGGGLLIIVGSIRGEWATFNPANVSANSWAALAYLTLFGSIIGFTAYSWLLKNVEPSLASTYAYVNPIVAVFLGWAVAGESLTGQMLLGAGIIVGSVILITSQEKNDDNEKDTEEIHRSNTPTGKPKALSASA